jgi:hypothetical protein
MASVTVLAIAVFGIGEQMLADGFTTPLQMRYIVTAFVIAQIVGVAIYELTSYDARLSMATYNAHMNTVQLLDHAKIQEAESFADVIQAEAEKRATYAHALANQVRAITAEVDQSVIIPTPNNGQPDPKVTQEKG